MDSNHNDTVEIKPKKKNPHRTYYDTAFKLKVVRLSRQVGGIRKEAKMCGVDESNNGFLSREKKDFQTTIAQKLSSNYTEKLIEFQKHVIKMRKLHNYPLCAMGKADETPVYFDMPGATTVHPRGQKTVTIRTSGNEKLRVSVMLAALADGTKLPPFVILKRQQMPKEHLPKGTIFVRCQEKG
ncbi:hypothetical protein GEV33_006298 [Tenebrio molitor]|uniref:Uncharacterized protein n=1 Tax=Tenebrio molitor TaxID=7067 RepID=A0A8J6HLJ4_TENMO|nr:hypothetical protein GEV33_006298 [Tenebrio molitor]